MIIPDAYLLIYAYDSRSPFHAKAKAWLEALLNGEEEVGLCPVVLFAFVRIATNARAFEQPMTVGEARGHVRYWLDEAITRLVEMDEAACLGALEFLDRAGAGANLTTDAQIAAIAVANWAIIHSADADFYRFGMDWKNPLN